MTLEDWCAVPNPRTLLPELSSIPDRKLHLLTVAFLRRIWDDLPSHHTQLAVEATEKFADGRMTSLQLGRVRTDATLEESELLWIGEEQYMIDDHDLQPDADGISMAVHAGLSDPARVAANAAFFARRLIEWRTFQPPNAATRPEAITQFDLFCEINGPGWTDPRWPRWRTSDVLALARGIYRDQAFELLPILADALQDAGCDDNTVLSHCREGKNHVRGCWVVDLALGIS